MTGRWSYITGEVVLHHRWEGLTSQVGGSYMTGMWSYITGEVVLHHRQGDITSQVGGLTSQVG